MQINKSNDFTPITLTLDTVGEYRLLLDLIGMCTSTIDETYQVDSMKMYELLKDASVLGNKFQDCTKIGNLKLVY